MVNKLIENYINSMSINDVIKFANENNIYLSEKEADLIYRTIKKDWYTIIYGDYHIVFQNIKELLNENTYKKVEELFFYFRDKYQKFL